EACQPTDLNDVLSRTLKLIETSLPANVQLVQDFTAQLPKILGDAEQLKQVFINLALNAVQAMPDGGKLTVRTRRPRAAYDVGLSEVSPHYNTDHVELRSEDT